MQDENNTLAITSVDQDITSRCIAHHRDLYYKHDCF